MKAAQLTMPLNTPNIATVESALNVSKAKTIKAERCSKPTAVLKPHCREKKSLNNFDFVGVAG